jgi:hypothetical protein
LGGLSRLSNFGKIPLALGYCLPPLPGTQTEKISSLFYPQMDSPAEDFSLAARRMLSTGKLDLALGFGGNPVAGCRPVPPGPHGLKDAAVTGNSGTFQDERTVYPAIGTDDETDFHLSCRNRRSEQRVGSGQSLRWLNRRASGTCADVGNFSVLGSSPQSDGNLSLSMIETRRVDGIRCCPCERSSSRD